LTRDAKLKSYWARAQHGVPAGYPIAQFPNAPLLAAFGAWIVAEATDDSAHDYARAAFYVGLAAWAWLETTDGANLFRRALGALGLVYVVVKVGVGFGA
jgi:drug/metabolite transporter superfamily protein YnfA